ncbi:MAG: DUF4293 domain-containing protein [[Clostridium] fimetarium]|nr:DUF4293 domain-containing protein [Alistipes timonensis]MCM1406786.1 DUF4293 domain-containing protein [[Clostridium] fimetarium]
MVIQRWQSVWLLFAAILVAMFCFVPVAVVSDPAAELAVANLTMTDFPVLAIVNGLVALLLFIAIFLYKNTRRQKTVTLLSMLLICVVAVVTVTVALRGGSETARVEIGGSVLLLLGALIFAAMAYRGIRSDEKLLRAADRLR